MTDQEKLDQHMQHMKLLDEDIKCLNIRLDRLHTAVEVITGIKFDLLEDMEDIYGFEFEAPWIDRSIYSMNEAVSIIISEIRELNQTIAILRADRTMAPYFFRKAQEENNKKND